MLPTVASSPHPPRSDTIDRPVHPSSPPGPTKKAVVVGIRYYGTEGERESEPTDSHRTIAKLQEHFGFHPKNIMYLTDVDQK